MNRLNHAVGKTTHGTIGGGALFALKLLAFATTIASIASKLLLPPLQLGHVLGCKCDVEVIASRHALLLCSDSL